MVRTLGVAFILAVAGGITAQEPKPFPLDKLDPAVRPPKGMPKEVIANQTVTTSDHRVTTP